MLLAHAAGADPLAVGAASKPILLLHGSSHLVYLDCLHDGAAQAAGFGDAAAANLPEFDVRKVGEMHGRASASDVEAAVGRLRSCSAAPAA